MERLEKKRSSSISRTSRSNSKVWPRSSTGFTTIRGKLSNGGADFDRAFPRDIDNVIHERFATAGHRRPERRGRSFCRRLIALADHAQFCRAGRIERIVARTRAGDKGGRTNLHRASNLGPRPRAWWFSAGRSSARAEIQATAYRKRIHLCRFLHAVHEFATGKTEESATLQTWIKRLAKPLRTL